MFEINLLKRKYVAKKAVFPVMLCTGSDQSKSYSVINQINNNNKKKKKQ